LAFNFFGTFTIAQWYEFKDFVSIQRAELGSRANWLTQEIQRIGVMSITYDGDTPTSFTAPDNTYMGKLLLAYRMLGGVPERDMLLRNVNQPVFLHKGTTQSTPETFTNGRQNRGSTIFDRDQGLLVDKLKKWQLESIKMKREHLEYKIKRTLDYSDQLQSELNTVKQLTIDNQVMVDMMITNIENSIQNPDTYTTPGATLNDIGDPYGLKIGPIGDGSVINAASDAVEDNQRVPKRGSL
jgi:hypothetical protein